MTWDGVFEGINGLEATLSPINFSLGGGASTSFSLTVDDVTGLTPGQWYFGTVTWTEQSDLAPVARFPVAVRVTASTDEVIVTKTADPSGTETGGTVDYEITVRNKVNQQRAFSVSDVVPAQLKLCQWFSHRWFNLQWRDEHPQLVRKSQCGSVCDR